MELTPAHLRYLLAIYEVSQTHLDISSRSIAEKLGVTKPSVVRVLNLLMERGMIVKEYYGKIYLTSRGIFVAREVKKQLDEVLAHFPPVAEELTDEELDTIADVAISILRSILSHFDAANSPIDEYEGDEGELILDVTAPDLAVLIGRHGRTLDALQVMFSLLVSRKLGFRYPVVVDVEGYKSRRQDKVASMAQSAAERAIRTHKSVSLPPMNAYERRLVHIALRGNDAVDTHSEGSDPDRHVVIVAR